jgi:hypothetical protein
MVLGLSDAVVTQVLDGGEPAPVSPFKATAPPKLATLSSPTTGLYGLSCVCEAVVAGALGEIPAWLMPTGNGNACSAVFLVGGFIEALTLHAGVLYFSTSI